MSSSSDVILDIDSSLRLAKASGFFFLSFIVFSLISAVLLQAAHEGLRSIVNRLVVFRWLRLGVHTISLRDFLLAVGSPGGSLFSLPYWQLTGQINAALASQLNFYPSSKLVDILANVDKDYLSEASTRVIQAHLSEKIDAAVFREVASKAQAGVNSLHTYLRNYWNMFDYYFGFLVVAGITGLMTTLVLRDGQRFQLYAVAFCAWLATPIVRRMIERLVPFR